MARQPKRLYVPLDVAFFDDEKIIHAGEKAAWLYLALLAKAKQLDTDGVLTKGQITRLGIPGTPARLKALLEAELIFELPLQRDTYAIGGWHKWNESKDDRATRLANDRKRKEEERARRIQT